MIFFGNEILRPMLPYCPVLHLYMLRLCWDINIKTLKYIDFFYISYRLCDFEYCLQNFTSAKCLVSISSMSNFVYLIEKYMHLRFFYSLAMYMKLSSNNMSQIYLRTCLRLMAVSRNNPILRYPPKNHLNFMTSKHRVVLSLINSLINMGVVNHQFLKEEQTYIIIHHVVRIQLRYSYTL